MESLASTAILDFHPDTLQHVRKQYDLDRPDRLKEAVDIMEDWVKKQNHFEVKSFPRAYLERLIINNKGSLEKSKKKLDTICTLRTLSPDYFDFFDLCNCRFDIMVYKIITTDYTSYLAFIKGTFNECQGGPFPTTGTSTEPATKQLSKLTILPKLTPEHCRVGVFKASGKLFSNNIFLNYFKYAIMISDYQQLKDYCNGVTYLVDYTDASLIDYVLNTNVLELKKFMDIFMGGYSMRIKNFHILSSSKSVETLLMLFKQALSDKVYKRIHLHKKIDTVYDYIPKDILPLEYGGKEKPIKELQDNLVKELSSRDFIKCRTEMNKCCTNESHRQDDKFNEEYSGMSGTFRNLRVD